MSEGKQEDSYAVVPRQEYDKLYNKQYVELTMLKKKIDPEEKNEKFLEMTFKTYYPKVYADMIKNDYILTHSTKTQQHLDQLPDGDYANKRCANLQMQ